MGRTCASPLLSPAPRSRAPPDFDCTPIWKWESLRSSSRSTEGNSGGEQGDDGQPAQLYDVEPDRAEKENLLRTEVDVAKRMADLLEQAVKDGRTRPGPKLKNDVPVDIWKTREGRPPLLR